MVHKGELSKEVHEIDKVQDQEQKSHESPNVMAKSMGKCSSDLRQGTAEKPVPRQYKQDLRAPRNAATGASPGSTKSRLI